MRSFKQHAGIFQGCRFGPSGATDPPSVLLYDHHRVIQSTCGVQQGDPLGPLYFCCGIAGLVEKIQKFGPRYNKWYMDDGGIIAPTGKLVAIWRKARSWGLS